MIYSDRRAPCRSNIFGYLDQFLDLKRENLVGAFPVLYSERLSVHPISRNFLLKLLAVLR